MTRSRGLVLLYAAAGLVLAGLVLASHLTGHPLARFTRDPAAHFGFHPTTGILSNLGVLFWTAGAACAAFAARVLAAQGREEPLRRFFAHAAALTTVLLLDDFFLGHDWFFVEVVPIGEKPIYAIYLLLTLALLVVHRAAIRSTHTLLLLLALGWFGTSVMVDLLPPGTLPLQHLFEDGAKFLGIVSWGSYYVTAGLEAIRS